MITVEKLSFSFPLKELYDEISFTIENGQHCAFIGSSGSGKSTLIDMIMDTEKYLYDGQINIDPNCRIGYVSQFYKSEKESDLTVFEYVAQDFSRIQDEITAICKEMETSSDIEPLLEKYQLALDSLEAIGGDDFESLIEKKLNLADLGNQRNLKIGSLSGGEFKLIQVIKEMLNSPNLLIMDEPDVFLDFENLTSLKNLINSYKGMILVITHNRYILNHCFNKILHLENKELNEFEGTYIDYNLSLLQTKIELQEQSIADDEEIERNEALVNRLRFIATHNAEAARGKALKARVKYQERLVARRTKAPFVDIKQPKIKLQTDSVPEDVIALRLEDYDVAFDEALLHGVSFEIKSTDKVALIGPNGTGKTTVLREIFNQSHDGIFVHEDIEMAYLSQKQGETLNENNSLRQEFVDLGFTSHRDIRFHLYGFGFKPDMLDQKISDLSGGEKNILQLAKLSAGNANLLLLDEPTSHLDTYSQIALDRAIENYPGAVLMISHDFYSIANCMDYVLLIEDKGIRKVSMRKFRKTIYKKHFDKDYLEIEQRKKEVETKVALALKAKDFEKAQKWVDKLDALIQKL